MGKRVLSVILVLSVLCISLTGCSKLKATTMRLLGYEGRVVLQENGRNKKVKEEARINSGSEIKTSIFSSATIGLDDVKIVSMDQSSVAEFVQSGKKLEMNLTKGSIFFEVKKPLADDETFEITTSTMIVGIRGTSGYVEIAEDGTERLIVTDGVVHVVYKNPETGEVTEADVRAGEEFRSYYLDESMIDDRDNGDDGNDSGDEGSLSGDGDDANGEDENVNGDDDNVNVDDDNTNKDEGSVNNTELTPGFVYEITDVTKETFPAFARNYILKNEEVKEKISGDMGEDELDELLWDKEYGYELSPDSYGNYASLKDVINALEQLEMVFRITAYTLNRDAEGLEHYLESKSVPGAQYITDFGFEMLEAIQRLNSIK